MRIIAGIVIVVLLIGLLAALVYGPRLRTIRTGHDSGGADDTADDTADGMGGAPNAGGPSR